MIKQMQCGSRVTRRAGAILPSVVLCDAASSRPVLGGLWYRASDFDSVLAPAVVADGSCCVHPAAHFSYTCTDPQKSIQKASWLGGRPPSFAILPTEALWGSCATKEPASEPVPKPPPPALMCFPTTRSHGRQQSCPALATAKASCSALLRTRHPLALYDRGAG